MDETDILSVSSSSEVCMRATIKKKTYNLDEAVIEKARRLFNVKTKTEAIHQALQKAVEEQEIQAALDRLLQEGRFRTVYR
jgi:Arc/MetJ family transcription regulator